MTDPRPPRDIFHGTFAVPATITVPGGSPVAAQVARLPQPPSELALGDGSIRVTETRNVFSIRLDQVPVVPRGTVVVAEGKTWAVDALEDVDDEVAHAVVIEMPA